MLKRRQERELQQMLMYEVTRKELLDKQQRKIDAMEARAAELARQKAENEKLWTQKQHELELQKVGGGRPGRSAARQELGLRQAGKMQSWAG